MLKIPLIKIGVGITGKEYGQGERAVLISTGREGARTEGPLFLGLQKLRPSASTTGRKMSRGDQYGPLCSGRIVHTQLNILDVIPVARILVHPFEELKAK